MKVLCVIAFMFCAASAWSIDNLKGDRILRLYDIDSTEEQHKLIQVLLSELDVWGTNPDGGLDVRVPTDYIKSFNGLGLNVTDATMEHVEHFNWFESADQVCTKSAEECATDDFYTRYQRHAAILTRFQTLASAHHDLMALFSWGQSFEGRNMGGAKISGHGGGNQKPVIFYFCGEHAREWLPPMFCTFMAEQLVTQYGNNADVTALMDHFEFHILPVMNPDGYEFSHSGNNMWRKSRRPNTDRGSSCIGTDLNRNWRFRWNNGGSSDNPCSDTYHGASALNNVETANLARYATELGSRLKVQTDVHAYGQMWMHPWGWTTALSSDNAIMQRCGDATAAAIRATNGLSFRTGTIANVIYIASGSSCDHFYGENGVVYSYAPEVRGSSFQPPTSNIGPSNAELWAGMIAQAQFVRSNPL